MVRGDKEEKVKFSNTVRHVAGLNCEFCPLMVLVLCSMAEGLAWWAGVQGALSHSLHRPCKGASTCHGGIQQVGVHATLSNSRQTFPRLLGLAAPKGKGKLGVWPEESTKMPKIWGKKIQEERVWRMWHWENRDVTLTLSPRSSRAFYGHWCLF